MTNRAPCRRHNHADIIEALDCDRPAKPRSAKKVAKMLTRKYPLIGEGGRRSVKAISTAFESNRSRH
jgi:hypothetical protein